MCDNDAQTPRDQIATANENVLEEGGSYPTAMLEPVSARECTSFFGVAPHHVRVTAAGLGAIDIQVMPTVETSCAENLIHTLHQLLELTPLGWNWSLDLAAVKTFNLRFMDSLLTIGHHLHLVGGALTIKRFRVPASLAVFWEVFQRQCMEHNITLVMCDLDSTE